MDNGFNGKVLVMTLNEFDSFDNNYNESMFITRVNNIFTKLFTGIMFQNLDDIRHNISDNVYKFATNIISENKDKNLRRMYDELNIKNTDIVSRTVSDNYFEVEVIITTRYLKYFIKLDSGDYVSGDKDNRVMEKYRLIFKKRKNTKVQKSVRYCTNCGASIDINDSGKCRYCNTYYDSAKYDYILDKIEEV